MAKKIYIDPGHGRNDSGAVKGTRLEKDDNLRLSLLIAEELKEQDAEVLLSRYNDTNPGGRTAQANAWGADYYLAMHRNSAGSGATGNEIWVVSNASQNTILKAKAILDAVCSVDGLPNRGVKKGAPNYTDFGVNRDSVMASALLELGFISNEKDNAVFDKSIGEYAKVIAKALCEIVGVVFKEKPALAGDVDGDGKITAADARTALRASAGLEALSEEQKKAADMNGDNVITAADARDILRKSAGLE
ncbi:MAG: N-acetylmuramoyl-L-alanine amidase [Oscillospiraceae bacterium]|jgi:N-acetylmuramoyl-L-alanine amidase|nr:N-acetylmuramoyl-L-alanine amidase [Oscillospiraceae bacterium]